MEMERMASWSQFPKLGKQTSPNTKIAFSSLITRKDKKDFDKKVQEARSE